MTNARTFSSPLDLQSVRADFPILSRELAGGFPLVYLDSANSSQKPRQVVQAIEDHYLKHNANVARAMHQLGAEATAAYEGGRDKVAAFIGAPYRDEIVFTKNASEALNLAAHTLGASLKPGDVVVISEMEHHSNIVPWQLACERTGATLKWFGVTDEGRLDLSNIDELITENTKVVVADLGVERARHDQPDHRHRRQGARGRRDRGRGRVAGGAAVPGRRVDARRGPAGLHRSQGGRPDRHRRALGPVRPARRRCRRSSVAAR